MTITDFESVFQNPILGRDWLSQIKIDWPELKKMDQSYSYYDTTALQKKKKNPQNCLPMELAV